jgi:hypothetical protein
VADANTVIRALGGQLAEALIAKTIAEVEVGELREREAARSAIDYGEAAPVADMEPTD